ncbi:SRPBCC family protein [Actinomycetospora sp. TBRC 11914]|uniref:SRPBCC family protein n=1 Tax=Actinomycetospora sp. TBRC 11914 TaxID=2729387 RepID=UPI00145E9B18|nr:SRPBCC family protein [Actinomycetospora sp. TBRC 11914]NMO93619.1 SRPBCC family protein [Actinomycetospora sp. TBRC 11914]
MEWTGARYADQPEVEVETWVAAPPDRVWPLVSDVERMPGMSGELRAVEWADGATGPAAGARFVGHSSHPALGEWSATATVVTCEPDREFAWEVDGEDGPAARWSFRISDDDGGSRVRQRVRLGPGRSGLSHAIDRMPDKEQKIVHVRLREFEASMQATLEAIRAAAEASS